MTDSGVRRVEAAFLSVFHLAMHFGQEVIGPVMEKPPMGNRKDAAEAPPEARGG
jgi:hypothetical protein